MKSLVPTKVFLTKGVGRHKYQLKSFEEALRKANDKFRRRFMMVEDKVCDSGREMKSYSLEELDVFWEEAKKNGE